MILINLDSQRNIMLRLGLQLEMGMFSAAISGLIGMAFGMNLQSSLEEVCVHLYTNYTHPHISRMCLSLKLMLIIPSYTHMHTHTHAHTRTHSQNPYAFWVLTGFMVTTCGLLWRRLLMFVGKSLDRPLLKKLSRPQKK